MSTEHAQTRAEPQQSNAPATGSDRRSALSRLTTGSVLPWLAILFLGSVALGVWFLVGPSLHGTRYYKVGYNRTAYEYSRPILFLFVPYGLALLAWRRGRRAPLWVLLAGAAALHLLVLFAPLPQSQDFYQYLFYGRMQAVHGANPFTVNPSTFWADPWFPWIRWNTQPSVYGPAWILLSFGVVKAAGNNLAHAFVGLKLAILALDATVVALILALARDRSDPAGWRGRGWGVLAYAWNPLVLITVPLAGTADVAVAAGLLGAVLARRRGRNGMATALLALASLVKVYAVIGLAFHLVLLARERGVKRAVVHAWGALGLAAVAFAPYWAGVSTFQGLVNMARRRNQSLVGSLERIVLRPVLSALGYGTPTRGSQLMGKWIFGVLLAAVVVWAVRKVRDERSLWGAVLVVLTAYLLLSPWFLYWYILGPLALVAVLPRNRLTYPILTFSGTALITVYLTSVHLLLAVQSLLRYVPPILVFALQGRLGRAGAKDRRRPALRLSEPASAPTPSSAAVAGRAPAAK
jgi:glycosyl transferase family 87